MGSFDVVSKLDHHEVDNALDQVQREISQRYDFKGTGAEVEKTDEGIVIKANSDDRCRAVLSVIQDKMIKRKVSLKSLKINDPTPAGGSTYRQLIELKEGVDKDAAKKLVKMLKETKLKVQASIQGDVVRVSHKKRDVLQDAIALIKAEKMDIPLQYQNFRD